jgi:hypothetical protein
VADNSHTSSNEVFVHNTSSQRVPKALVRLCFIRR